jgi:hypothetical protein
MEESESERAGLKVFVLIQIRVLKNNSITVLSTLLILLELEREVYIELLAFPITY